MLKPFLPHADAPDNCRPREIARPAIILLSVITVGAFFPQLSALVSRWMQDPQYSHGFFVPVLAVMIARHRADDIVLGSTQPSKTGLWFIAGGMAAYLIGAHIYFDWLQQVAMLPVLFGGILILGGRWLAQVSWPSVLFLLFMIPLPYAVEVAMAQPLQNVAGKCSTFALQTLGVAAIRTGNLIDVEGHVLGVAEACSGLRMLVVFFALSTAVAILIQRSWLQKIILMFSAIPIALFCNILRITATGLLYVYAGPEMAEKVFHDLAGWLMMPIALLMMWLELKFLGLVIDDSWGASASGGERSAGVFSTAV